MNSQYYTAERLMIMKLVLVYEFKIVFLPRLLNDLPCINIIFSTETLFMYNTNSCIGNMTDLKYQFQD